MKKVGGMSFQTILMIVALVFLAIIMAISMNPTKSFFGEITSAKLVASKAKCATQTEELNIQKGVVSKDNLDGDDYADFCDVCAYQEKTGKWVGNNKQDADRDGMPDACDPEPNDEAVIVSCDSDKNLEWNKKKTRCIIKA